MRLFRAVRAVGFPLYLCAVCARLCAVYAPCGGMPAVRAPVRGSSVALCGGRSTTVFSRSHLKPSAGIRSGVPGGSGRSVLQHCTVLNKRPRGLYATGLF